MVNTAKGNLHKYRQVKNGKVQIKHFIYVPLVVSADSMFPCKLEPGKSVKVQIRIDGKTVKVEETTK